MFRNNILVVDEDGTNLGSMSYAAAKQHAEDAGLDLIEVSKQGKNPVYRIMDEGKWKYERKKQSQKNKQRSLSLKEMKFRLTIDPHDQATKVNHIKKFLGKGYSVKLLVQLKGREKANSHLANEKLASIITEIGEVRQGQIKCSTGQVHTIVHPIKN